MRTYPDGKWDLKELENLNAPEWMVDLLKVNPSYPFWGPYEDYMAKRGKEEGKDDLGRNKDHGWESRIFIDSWEDFDWVLDEYNECVNFYFEINRNSKQCPFCAGIGYTPDAQWVSESFYTHSSPFKMSTERELQTEMLLASFSGSIGPHCVHGQNTFPNEKTLNKYGKEFRDFCEQMKQSGEGWGNISEITEDEIQALKDENRWRPDDVSIQRMGFDAIDRSILIRQRCKRFGIDVSCYECEGDGTVFTALEPHISLTLWIIHPRKGASRGVMIKKIEKENLPEVFKWLQEASKRNVERFSKINNDNLVTS